MYIEWAKKNCNLHTVYVWHLFISKALCSSKHIKKVRERVHKTWIYQCKTASFCCDNQHARRQTLSAIASVSSGTDDVRILFLCHYRCLPAWRFPSVVGVRLQFMNEIWVSEMHIKGERKFIFSLFAFMKELSTRTNIL